MERNKRVVFFNRGQLKIIAYCSKRIGVCLNYWFTRMSLSMCTFGFAKENLGKEMYEVYPAFCDEHLIATFKTGSGKF